MAKLASTNVLKNCNKALHCLNVSISSGFTFESRKKRLLVLGAGSAQFCFFNGHCHVALLLNKFLITIQRWQINMKQQMCRTNKLYFINSSRESATQWHYIAYNTYTQPFEQFLQIKLGNLSTLFVCLQKLQCKGHCSSSLYGLSSCSGDCNMPLETALH